MTICDDVLLIIRILACMDQSEESCWNAQSQDFNIIIIIIIMMMMIFKQTVLTIYYVFRRVPQKNKVKQDHCICRKVLGLKMNLERLVFYRLNRKLDSWNKASWFGYQFGTLWIWNFRTDILYRRTYEPGTLWNLSTVAFQFWCSATQSALAIKAIKSVPTLITLFTPTFCSLSLYIYL